MGDGDDAVGGFEGDFFDPGGEVVGSAELFFFPGAEGFEAMDCGDEGGVVEHFGHEACEGAVPGMGVDDIGVDGVTDHGHIGGEGAQGAVELGVAVFPHPAPALVTFDVEAWGWVCLFTDAADVDIDEFGELAGEVFDMDAGATVDVGGVFAGEEGDFHSGSCGLVLAGGEALAGGEGFFHGGCRDTVMDDAAAADAGFWRDAEVGGDEGSAAFERVGHFLGHDCGAIADGAFGSEPGAFIGDDPVEFGAGFDDDVVEEDGVDDGGAGFDADAGGEDAIADGSCDHAAGADEAIFDVGAGELACGGWGCGPPGEEVGADFPGVKVDFGLGAEEVLVELEVFVDGSGIVPGAVVDPAVGAASGDHLAHDLVDLEAAVFA